MITRGNPAADRIIDLDGEEGNAFALIGKAIWTARQLEWDNARIDGVVAQMKGGDYYTLLKVFDDNFGAIWELQTTNEEILKRVG